MRSKGVRWVAGRPGSTLVDFTMIWAMNKLFYVLYPPNLALLRAYKHIIMNIAWYTNYFIFRYIRASVGLNSQVWLHGFLSNMSY